LKKFVLILLVSSILIISMGIILNIDVTTRKGINFQVQTIRTPLYLKLLNFFDRHYNYKNLVKRLINNSDNEKERVMKLFEWTNYNIKRVPEDFPVIDDHVWHIIIRGYGTSDQSSDVFTTLCNYAGIDAFFTKVYTQDHSRRILLSFVRINGRWSVFDPYHGVYFKDNKGDLADIETLKLNRGWTIEGQKEKSEVVDYSSYFQNLPDIKDIGLKRANIQSPLKRLVYEIKKLLK